MYKVSKGNNVNFFTGHETIPKGVTKVSLKPTALRGRYSQKEEDDIIKVVVCFYDII